VSEGNLRR